ncbi:MAG: hypothetical protein ABR907_03885 [Terracidiphilus sp.]|jgi:hypothetical protein
MMKAALKTIAPLLLLFVILGSNSAALADAGVYYGAGQDLHQITSKSIHLVSIDVTIVLGAGKLPATAEFAALDKKTAELVRKNLAEYRCIFVLKSLSDRPEEVQVGFPVDPAADNGNDIDDYAFVARDDKETYSVKSDVVQWKPKSGTGDSGSIFSWMMHFAPREIRTLTVTYQIAISMGLESTNKNVGGGTMSPDAKDWYRTRWRYGALRPETLDLALVREAGYITSTGSSWSGNVESATFTLITDSVDKQMNQDGIPGFADESNPASKRIPPFPLEHPIWFRKITPTGWKPVKGGVQWSYKDYKPKDSIGVSYYFTQLPKTPEDVDKFVDWFLSRLKTTDPYAAKLNQQEPTDSVAAELIRVRDVILAVYGKEPSDSLTKRFVEEQLWYAPLKDYSYASLSETQKAVLAKLDARIEIAKGMK